MLVILLLAVVAITTGANFWHRQRCDRLAEELRALAGAFQGYERRNGHWPAPSNGARVIPRGLETELRDTAWLKPTPVGGSYQWLVPYPPPSARENVSPESAPAASPPPALAIGGALAVTAFRPDAPLALSPADLLYLDAKIDDGNLATGQFRTGFNGWPIYLVPPRR